MRLFRKLYWDAVYHMASQINEIIELSLIQCCFAVLSDMCYRSDLDMDYSYLVLALDLP